MLRRPLDGALAQMDVVFVPETSPLRQDRRWAQQASDAPIVTSIYNLSARNFSRLGLHRLALRARVAQFLRTGEPEARLLAVLAPPGRTAVDVGAADGLYCWLLSRLNLDIVAFEPNPISFPRLKQMMPWLDVRQVALSKCAGQARLRVPVTRGVHASGWGTIHQANDFTGLAADVVTECEVTTAKLDDAGLGDIGFIKIDVEGHELEVLQGAAHLLANARPNLLVELGCLRRGSNPEAVLDLLHQARYAILHLPPDGAFRQLTKYPDGVDSINIVCIADRRS